MSLKVNYFAMVQEGKGAVVNLIEANVLNLFNTQLNINQYRAFMNYPLGFETDGYKFKCKMLVFSLEKMRTYFCTKASVKVNNLTSDNV